MDHRWTHLRPGVRSLCLGALVFGASCTSMVTDLVPPSNAQREAEAAVMRAQSLAMEMADDYIAALGEAVYVIARDKGLTPRARTLAQSFLRNGVGAAIDIGSGPNPFASVVDMIVLSDLQTWAFGAHWIPEGIGDAGIPALERLKKANQDLHAQAMKVLTPAQDQTLRELVAAWIQEHPDRMVVSLVRFDEFAQERMLNSTALRGKANGLLREVSQASAAIDDARLLGERLIWYAGRYPYLMGQQAELTAYRMADQPESREVMDAIESVRKLSDTFGDRVSEMEGDLQRELDRFFERVTAERTATINQARDSLATVVRESLDDAEERIAKERDVTIEQFFNRIGVERTAMLDDIDRRQNELTTVLKELRETIEASQTLATQLTGTVEAIDRVVSRFDKDATDLGDPISLADVRDAAIEAGNAAQRVTDMLDRTDALLQSDSVQVTLAELSNPADALVDRMFWRGLVLIVVLIGGLAALRLVPNRRASGRVGS